MHLHRKGELALDEEPLPDAVDALEVALLQEDVVLPRQSLLGRNNIKTFLGCAFSGILATQLALTLWAAGSNSFTSSGKWMFLWKQTLY